MFFRRNYPEIRSSYQHQEPKPQITASSLGGNFIEGLGGIRKVQGWPDWLNTLLPIVLGVIGFWGLVLILVVIIAKSDFRFDAAKFRFYQKLVLGVKFVWDAHEQQIRKMFKLSDEAGDAIDQLLDWLGAAAESPILLEIFTPLFNRAARMV